MSAIIARRLCAHADLDGAGMHWLEPGQNCPMAEHEYTVIVSKVYVNAPDEPAVVIGISAHGGGTVGESYADNGWSYAVYVDGRELIVGSDLHSGAMGATHAEMARTLCAFLSADGESEYRESRESPVYVSTEAGEFLIAEYERLGVFASDLV